MTLYVDPTAPNAAEARSDLKKICPDPGMTINATTGKVDYPNMTMSGVGCQLVWDIANESITVWIRGTDPSLLDVDVDAQGTILDPGGIMRGINGSEDPDSDIEIVYDATECQGAGMWVLGKIGASLPAPIDDPSDVTLFHELTHAIRRMQKLDPPAHSPSDTFDTRETAEEEARKGENQWRAARTPALPLRVVTGYASDIGGCNPPPPSYSSTSPASSSHTSTKCFVASAAYGSEFEPEVEMLRYVRDHVLMRTRAGARFFDDFYDPYYRVSPTIVQMMEADPRVMDAVRWAIVHPVVSHLEQALSFPDAPLDDVPEPWRSFLARMRDSLEEWSRAIEPPRDFEGMTVTAAATEIDIALRYLFRTPESRAAYIDELEAAGALPLHGRPCELAIAARRLRAAGRSDAEVARIVGDVGC